MAKPHTAPEAADSESSAADREFRWRGGRVSLNFTATLGRRGLGAIERLRDPSDLSRWFREAGMTDHHLPVSQAELADARALREAVHRISVAAGEATAPEAGATAPAAADLDLLNHWTSQPLPGTGLTLDGHGVLRPMPPALDVHGLLGLLARDAADLLGGPLSGRIRECAATDCTLLFVDESRAGARRWCSMDACGARAKMAEYRARRRGVTAGRGGQRPR
ncbi:CGNR zinc finger domain-containing protein [Streptomyces flavofungini]|uniref:CGNR zinc finger domain-containing protein n=1 Tax=Streptomyces flavofungini TaxID=68200 RepID=A0ABS0X9W2_9ACTN|nr:ABATE domain-containing protein [Streptomyces flavofungini]MBJ3809973.1 CGNR zinc finger domain-containing protein [Streptomyces flavofungini]GHC53683.1 hypothetical protein GCM10010349_19880 [Streptomyces flavofungini]